MQRQLVFKILIISILIGLLLIPIGMIYGLINERMSLRDKVVNEIAKGSAYSQTITGPILVVPYKKLVYSSNDKQYYQKEGKLYFLPHTFLLDGNLNVEKRKRGIYEAQLYLLNNTITGTFKIPKNFGVNEYLDSYQFEQPFIAINISDIRGINNNSKISFDNTSLKIHSGTNDTKFGSAGIHAKLDLATLKQGGNYDYKLQFDLKGTSSLNISPVGQESSVSLAGKWPHPSFNGSFLPIARTITNEGFHASWQTNFFASDMEEKFRKCYIQSSCYEFKNNNFGVSLIEPVDHYLKSERALKYAILFIGLTFFGFFLFEMTKKLAIHPIQYSFVGISLALFFLLLLSLSEHIGFVMAYALSAIACISTIGFYITSILHNKKQGLGFTVMLTGLYAMLYILLNAEDYSLIMGSIFVFIIISTAMITTRNMDWYKVTTLPTNKQTINEESNHE